MAQKIVKGGSDGKEEKTLAELSQTKHKLEVDPDWLDLLFEIRGENQRLRAAEISKKIIEMTYEGNTSGMKIFPSPELLSMLTIFSKVEFKLFDDLFVKDHIKGETGKYEYSLSNIGKSVKEELEKSGFKVTVKIDQGNETKPIYMLIK